MPVLDIAYRYIKFDNSRFIHSIDMVGTHQNLYGSRDLSTPLSGTVCHPGLTLATINLFTKCLSTSTHCEDMKVKGDKNVDNGVVLGSQGSL